MSGTMQGKAFQSPNRNRDGTVSHSTEISERERGRAVHLAPVWEGGTIPKGMHSMYTAYSGFTSQRLELSLIKNVNSSLLGTHISGQF